MQSSSATENFIPGQLSIFQQLAEQKQNIALYFPRGGDDSASFAMLDWVLALKDHDTVLYVLYRYEHVDKLKQELSNRGLVNRSRKDAEEYFIHENNVAVMAVGEFEYHHGHDGSYIGLAIDLEYHADQKSVEDYFHAKLVLCADSQSGEWELMTTEGRKQVLSSPNGKQALTVAHLPEGALLTKKSHTHKIAEPSEAVKEYLATAVNRAVYIIDAHFSQYDLAKLAPLVNACDGACDIVLPRVTPNRFNYNLPKHLKQPHRQSAAEALASQYPLKVLREKLTDSKTSIELVNLIQPNPDVSLCTGQ